MSITFVDGTIASADLVIGADGIHSVVRAHYVVRHRIYDFGLVLPNLFNSTTRLNMVRW